MKELEYPFDSEYILKKSKKIRRQLLESGAGFLDKKIAVLGGRDRKSTRLNSSHT